MSEVNFGYNGNCLGMDSYRLDLFWDKVNIGDDGDCWNWTAGCHPNGYGQFWLKGSKQRSHRITYCLHNNCDFPPHGIVIRHTCNEPNCCNPLHLLKGTQQDNMDDMMASGNNVPHIGSTNGQSVLTEDTVLEIRRLYDETDISQRGLAKQFEVSQRTIWNIVNRTGWTHI